MPSLDMKGPYPFNEKSVDANVCKDTIGNYALGFVNEKGIFIVRYVGRSDTDLNRRIKDHLGEPYKSFKFSYAGDEEDAFTKECENYHDFNCRDNEIHPDKPDGRPRLKCPRCGT